MSDPGVNPFAKYVGQPAPAAAADGSSGAGSTNPFAKYVAPVQSTRERLGFPVAKSDFLGSVAHGGSSGLSDEIEAGLAAPVTYAADTLMGKKPKDATLGDYYEGHLEAIREGQQEYAKEHPVKNAAGEVLGSLLDINPSGAATAATTSIHEAAKQGAKVGAVMGATSGFGNAEGGIKNRAIGAAEGGIGGAAIGYATPYVIGGVQKASQLIKDAIAPWTDDLDTFINKTAGNVLNKAAGEGGAVFEEAPLPGMKPTVGQATNNEGLKWLENSVKEGTPGGREAAAEAATTNNQAIQKAIGSLGDLEADAPKAMSDAVEKASAAAKANTRAAWKAAGVDETTGVSATQLQQHVQNYLDSLSVAKRANIAPDLLDTLDTISKQGTTNLGEIQDWRSNVLGALRMAARNGDEAKAKVLGGLADNVSDFIDNIPMPEDAAAAYDAARAATKQNKETFNTPKAVRNVLGVDRYGEDKVPLSAVADTYIRSGKGAPEAFDSYLDAVDSQLRSAARPGQTAAERIAAVNDAKEQVEAGYQAARDAFAQRFLKETQTTIPDQQGSPFVSASYVRDFVDKHQHIIDSRIFSDEQRDLINRIADAADMTQRVARAARNGSDTFSKLQGKTFLDELIGPGAAKLVTWGSKILPAAGAAIGGKVGGVEGAALGAGIGQYGASKLQGALYDATRDKVVDLVTEAMNNPELAKTLMQTATKEAALKVPATQRQLIYSILGVTMARPAINYAVPKDRPRSGFAEGADQAQAAQ